jgi:hypothetical protein
MITPANKVEKFCGNCGSHNLYVFPTKMFCSTRFDHGKDPVVDTLWCCGDWTQVSQECYCVREAQKEKDKLQKRR